MSMQRKCDRCGKVIPSFEQVKASLFVRRLVKGRIFFDFFKDEGSLKQMIETSPSLELCDECTYSFTEWLEKGVNDEQSRD